MPSGSSLKFMMEKMPDRAFDVGICEQHAVTLSAGMATQGMANEGMANEGMAGTEGAFAKRMNDGFVCIKVDREERPDLDQIYQLVVQLMGRSGGWPLTVFLTRPESAAVKPLITSKSVDFPAPFGPMRPTIAPVGTTMDAPVSARIPRNATWTSSARTA